MKILITGANGQLGSEIKEISRNYPDYGFLFTDVDSLDLTKPLEVEEFIKTQKPDVLVNCAAYTAVDKAETDRENAMLINAAVPATLADLSRKYGYKIIHISTDYVFSGKTYLPVSEEEDTDPLSVYGLTKLQGEKNVLTCGNSIIIRTSWLYSIYGNNFVKTMLRLGKEKEQIGVVFDQIGSPTNAADLAYAILSIIKWGEENNRWEHGIYHYANQGVCSWFDFARTIMELGDRKCHVVPLLTHEYPLPAIRPAYSVLNQRKIRDTFGLTIPYWKDSLKNVIRILS